MVCFLNFCLINFLGILICMSCWRESRRGAGRGAGRGDGAAHQNFWWVYCRFVWFSGPWLFLCNFCMMFHWIFILVYSACFFELWIWMFTLSVELINVVGILWIGVASLLVWFFKSKTWILAGVNLLEWPQELAYWNR